ncbi:MAG: alpha/beta fold hydrolase [Magnetospiraceae bacterium]
MLPVSEGHKIYWEVSGNPDGIPALFLHGGPGAAALAIHRRFFDPAAYRIILLHQRGCGRSVPHATVEANTTDHLIADIEELRRHLDVEKWMVFGGSWGSTLALAYGIAFPDRCLGFILRGIFLCRPEEISWFMGGIARVFPDAWRDFEAAIPADERGDLLDAYRRRLLSPARPRRRRLGWL